MASQTGHDPHHLVRRSDQDRLPTRFTVGDVDQAFVAPHRKASHRLVVGLLLAHPAASWDALSLVDDLALGEAVPGLLQLAGEMVKLLETLDCGVRYRSHAFRADSVDHIGTDPRPRGTGYGLAVVVWVNITTARGIPKRTDSRLSRRVPGQATPYR